MKNRKIVTKSGRQGDVVAVRADDVPDSELEPMPEDPRGLVIAEGESSGHCHMLYGAGAKLMRFRDAGEHVIIADVGEDGEVRVVGGGVGGVPRHHTMRLAPGRWKIYGQDEYTAEDEFRARQTQD